jgi:SAM-dependent methyltransferase
VKDQGTKVVMAKVEDATLVHDGRYRVLVNGTIDHGLQFLAPDRRDLPTAYYGPNSGIGVVLRAIEGTRPLRVAIIGLGAGTLATYGHPGDRYTFYEINPLDELMARTEFTFLRDSRAEISIVPGDARLSLEHEPPQRYDVLAVDAFTGDSIPVHLLTIEAFRLYFRNLAPQGVLAIHISNRYLNLAPVVAAAAVTLDKEAIRISNPDDRANGIFSSSWVLVGASRSFEAEKQIEAAGQMIRRPRRNQLWTDDYSSLFRVLK